MSVTRVSPQQALAALAVSRKVNFVQWDTRTMYETFGANFVDSVADLPVERNRLGPTGRFFVSDTTPFSIGMVWAVNARRTWGFWISVLFHPIQAVKARHAHFDQWPAVRGVFNPTRLHAFYFVEANPNPLNYAPCVVVEHQLSNRTLDDRYFEVFRAIASQQALRLR